MKRSKRRRQSEYGEIRIRLYHDVDDQLIEWLRQFDGAPLGQRSRAVKEALLQGIQEQMDTCDGPRLTGEDLECIRRVVEAGVFSAMRRFGGVVVTPLEADGEDEETASMLDGLGESLIVEE